MTLSHSIGLTCWGQGCGKAFLGDSLRSPRPCDLLAIVVNSPKQTPFHLFLDTAVQTVAYLRVSTRLQDLAK